MTTAFLIFGIIILFTAINAVSEDNRLSKNKKYQVSKTKTYPTKEEYIEQIKHIQQSELQTEKFKNISSFITEYRVRKNIELEEDLFKIIDTFALDRKIFNKTVSEKETIRKEMFLEFKKFINSLSQEQIDSNLYLKAAKVFLSTAIKDCQVIEDKLKEQLKYMGGLKIPKRIEIDIDIPKETLSFLPNRISEQVKVEYFDPTVYLYEYIYLLDSQHRYIYSEYNEHVSKLDKLANNIYKLYMWSILSEYPEQIDNYYFNILNNSLEHQFLTAYFVKKTEPIIESSTYEIDDKTKHTISKIVGLPFEEIIKMSVDELDEYLEIKFHKNLNRDLEWTKILPEKEKIKNFTNNN